MLIVCVFSTVMQLNIVHRQINITAMAVLCSVEHVYSSTWFGMGCPLSEEMFGQPQGTHLRAAREVVVQVNICDAKSLFECMFPFEVVHQTPCNIGGDVHPICGYSLAQAVQVPAAAHKPASRVGCMQIHMETRLWWQIKCQLPWAHF